MTWQPMETAPTDGSWIRLWRKPSEKHWLFIPPEIIGRWDHGIQTWVWPEDQYQVFTESGKEDAELIIDSGSFYHSSEFTHWMPLTIPPVD